MWFLLVLFVVLIFLLFIYIEWKRNRFRDVEPPRLEGEVPLLGHAHIIIGSGRYLIELMKKISHEVLDKGGVMSMYIGPRVVYLVADPDDCYRISNENIDKSLLYDFLKPWLGNGIFTAPETIWKPNRKLLNPAFNSLALMHFLSVFNKQSRKLALFLQEFAGKGPFDQAECLCPAGMATIGLTSLGVNFEEHIRSGRYSALCGQFLDTVVRRFSCVWYHHPGLFGWTALKRRQDKYAEELHELTEAIMKKKLMNPKEKHDERNFKAFIDILLELRGEDHNDDSIMSKQQMRDELDTMILAGTDTSALTLSYAMVLLGSHPEVQDKVYEEIHGIFGDTDRDVNREDLSNLVLLDAVLKETMRLYPIAPMVFRKLSRDCVVKNYQLRAGSSVAIMIYALHRHSDWGSDAEQFNPRRWMNQETLPKNPLLFAGFSMGKRSCIGRIYAMMFMKTVLVHILRRYRIKSDISKMVTVFQLMMKPVEGHLISLEKRE